MRSAAARLQADWVVACDGGQSFVRNALGLALEGTAYTGRYVIVDIELPSTHPTERRAWFDPPWHRGATVLMHRQPDDLWRIDWQLRHGDSTEEAMQPENVRAFVQRHLDAIGEGHLPWQPAWSSIYRAGAMTLAALPPRPRALCRQCRACDADLRRARAELRPGRCRQPGLEAGRRGAGRARGAARQLQRRARAGLPRQCRERAAQHRVHVAAVARLRRAARGRAVAGRPSTATSPS